MRYDKDIKVLSEIREMYLEPVIQRHRKWKERSNALSLAIKALECQRDYTHDIKQAYLRGRSDGDA